MSMQSNMRGAMPRRITTFLCLIALLLPACASKEDSETEVASALQLAEAAREDFVAPSLEMLLAFADRVAPFCQARTEGEVLAIAERIGCSVGGDGDGAYTILCRDLTAGTQGLSLHARLEYLGENGVLGPPEAALSMRAWIEAAGDLSLVEGYLDCVDDPWRGIVLEGVLSTDYLGASSVWTFVEHVTVRPVADAADGVSVLFTSGSAELEVLPADGPVARASVALVGRRALVIVEVEGQSTTTEQQLG
jgi:hypothetical protein